MMDYEKEYKKLKADISKAYLYAQTDSTKAVLESILPELKESDDERIRKELIEQVIYIVPDINEIDDNGNILPCYTMRINKYIAWLEKRSEEARNIALRTEYEKGRADAIAEIQKSDNKIIPIFRAGDVIKRKNGNGDTVIVSQVDTQHQCYCYEAWDGAATNYCDFNIDEQDEWELAEQNSVWSEKDEIFLNRAIKVIKQKHPMTANWLKSIKQRIGG